MFHFQHPFLHVSPFYVEVVNTFFMVFHPIRNVYIAPMCSVQYMFHVCVSAEHHVFRVRVVGILFPIRLIRSA